MDKLIVITGATATGKTKLSLRYAQQNKRIEIINVDKTQFYKEVNIGVAKLPKDVRARVSHHFFDFLSIYSDKLYTVYQFQQDCRKKIIEIWKRGNTPLLVGGSVFYLSAVLFSFNFYQENPVVKNKLYEKYRLMASNDLYQQLCSKDLFSANHIHPNNIQKLIRANIYFDLHNKSQYVVNKWTPFFSRAIVEIIICQIPQQRLKEIIAKRTLEQFKSGFLDEVKTLITNHVNPDILKQFIGYYDIYLFLKSKQVKSSYTNLIQLITAKNIKYSQKQIKYLNLWKKCKQPNYKLHYCK